MPLIGYVNFDTLVFLYPSFLIRKVVIRITIILILQKFADD